MKFLSPLLIVLLLVAPASVRADGNRPAKLIPIKMAGKYALPPAKQLAVPVAQLFRVDEGVFELGVGKSIDLTDRKILLTLTKCRRDRQECEVRLNGSSSSIEAGRRFNLKDRFMSSTKNFVADKDVCVLDVTDIALPKGASGLVTFRLYCP